MALALRLKDPNERCSNCGIPAWIVWLMWEKGEQFPHNRYKQNNARLTVDHIIPGGVSTLENTRILCWSCNALRGANKQTDREVLRFIRRWFRERFNLRYLWWLNKKPGEGGTLHRNKYMERKMLKLLGGDV